MAKAAGEGYSYYFTCDENRPPLHFSGWFDNLSDLPSTYNDAPIPNGSIFHYLPADSYFYYTYHCDRDGNLVGEWAVQQ